MTGWTPGDAVWALYGAVGTAATPLARPYLRLRAARGKEDPHRFTEKLGLADEVGAGRGSIWCHAVSVGEAAALLPLVGALTRTHSVVMTTGTPTAAARVASAATGAAHQFAPLDSPPFVARFLDHWRPALAVFAESELWPTTVRTLSRRQIPVVQANARLSERSARRWGQVSVLSRPLFSRLSLVLAQTDADAARYRSLGAPHVELTGNLKFDAPALQANPAAVADLRRAIGERPVWLAASTHEGEDEIVLSAHKELLARRPDWLTMIAPRHVERGPAIAAMATEFDARLRSAGDPPAGSVYVADTLGELGTLFAVCPIVLMAGSFLRLGGHNPAEPAAARVAMLTGPDHGPMFQPFIDAGAADVVRAETLAGAVARLAADGALRDARSAAADTVLAVERGALDRTLDALTPLLPSPQVAL